ncbi:MAG: LysR substrate-binding domain-containing protein [Bryobacteraceae bacterium]
MELKHLRSFLAVAEHLSFRRAAEALYLSQPALSLQVRALEEELGFPLFLRDRRTVSLTAAGSLFAQEAREVLVRADDAKKRAQLANQGQIGQLRVGFISSAAAILIPPLIIQLRSRYPGIQLDLRNVLTGDQVVWLAEKRLDVGLLRLPLSSDEIVTTLIHREPFILLVPARHPLASRHRFSLEDLRDEHFIVYSRRLAPGFHDLTMSILNNAGVTPKIAQEAGEMYTIVSLVAAGLGIAILPQSVSLFGISGVVTRNLPPGLPPSDIGIAVRKNERSPVVRLFTELALSMNPKPGYHGYAECEELHPASRPKMATKSPSSRVGFVARRSVLP